MIYEYALEPEMVANSGTHIQSILYHEFGLAKGRLASRYPKKWVKKAWESFKGGSEIEKTRLAELLKHLKETMIKREGYNWEDTATWLDNALKENERFPFHAILVSENQEKRAEIIEGKKESISPFSSPKWDNPHGRLVKRNAKDMAEIIKEMLSCCCWVKFIDPYFSPAKPAYKSSFKAFFEILARERAVGPLKFIEIHTGHTGDDRAPTPEFLRNHFQGIIPQGLAIIPKLYQWKYKKNEQELHNRYILTDIGGVAFHHGLDSGKTGNNFDEVTRLTFQQYKLRCKQYHPNTAAFELVGEPIELKRA